MTASSASTTTSSDVCRTQTTMKRVLSLQHLKFSQSGIISSSVCTKDSLLQSCTPRRRYMRRGSRCPSMLRVTMSLPQDLSSLDPEISLSRVPPSPGANFSFLDSPMASSHASEESRNRVAVDLVTEALNLSTNFDEMDIHTNPNPNL